MNDFLNELEKPDRSERYSYDAPKGYGQEAQTSYGFEARTKL